MHYEALTGSNASSSLQK